MLSLPAHRRIVPAAAAAGLVAALLAAPAPAAIPDRTSTTTLTLPAALEPNRGNWCTWGFCSLTPRLYHHPLADGRTLVGWTDSALNGHVSVVSGSAITATFDFPARPVRGLVGHDDGSFAVLLLERSGTTTIDDDATWLSRRNAAGVEQWSVRVTSASNASNDVGDSRLGYGGGVYGAYLSVHGISGSTAGHEGDEYRRVSDAGATLTGGWTWGLSHSMAQLIDWHPGTSSLLTAGTSDCYPGKGLYAGRTRLLWAADGDCAGRAQVMLGQMAAAANQRWLVAFNAIERAGFPAKGVGLASFAPTGSAAITWLTNTTGADERDPVLARIGAGLGSNRFLVGWRLLSNGEYRLAVVDSTGALIEGPTVVSPAVKWGYRDDSFRTRPDGSVSWVRGDAGSTTLRLHRYVEATVAVPTADGGAALEVLPAFPNPLSGGSTRVRFRLEEGGPVTVRVLDAAGRLVKELLHGWQPPGLHEATWDGRDVAGTAVAPGVYFWALESAGTTATRKLAVTR